MKHDGLCSYGTWIRKYRHDNNILMKEMADKLGVGSSYLSHVESGRRGITMELITNLCKAYELNDDELNDLRGSLVESDVKWISAISDIKRIL